MKHPSPPPIRVVVCEDDPDLRGILLDGLPAEEMKLFGVPSAEALEHFLAESSADVLLLDLGLPGEDGLSVATRMRKTRPGLGIIVITARSEVADRVRGLSSGADQYFVKPVDLRELSAAIRSLHRRLAPLNEQAPPPVAWTLDLLRSALLSPKQASVLLSPAELEILKRLMASPGQTLPHDDLTEALGWGSDLSARRRLETAISRLRKKVAQGAPAEDFPLRVRHGDGYAFLGQARIP